MNTSLMYATKIDRALLHVARHHLDINHASFCGYTEHGLNRQLQAVASTGNFTPQNMLLTPNHRHTKAVSSPPNYKKNLLAHPV